MSVGNLYIPVIPVFVSVHLWLSYKSCVSSNQKRFSLSC